MPNTYSSLYCHTIFAVKFRHAATQNSFKKELFGVLGNLINESGCSTVIVNGVSDHVHALFKFYPKNSISEVMKGVKAKSSKWINENGFLNYRFEWQTGFGSFTNSQNQIGKLFDYIKNQDEHHEKITFREEYLNLLKAHQIEFLPEYLFKELE